MRQRRHRHQGTPTGLGLVHAEVEPDTVAGAVRELMFTGKWRPVRLALDPGNLGLDEAFRILLPENRRHFQCRSDDSSAYRSRDAWYASTTAFCRPGSNSLLTSAINSRRVADCCSK